MTDPLPRIRPGRFLLARRRLLVAILAGSVVAVALYGRLRWETHLLAAWNATAFVYVVLSLHTMTGATVAMCRRRAALYDEKDWVILALMIGAVIASFGAIVGVIIVVVTVMLSWTFVHVMYALHYAHLYYRPQHKGTQGGLRFPGDHEPSYADFLYYSFVIGCAAQAADVATTTPAMRRLTLFHGIVAFTFNAIILALMINLGASLIAGG